MLVTIGANTCGSRDQPQKSETPGSNDRSGEPGFSITQAEMDALADSSDDFRRYPCIRSVSRASLFGILGVVRAKVLYAGLFDGESVAVAFETAQGRDGLAFGRSMLIRDR